MRFRLSHRVLTLTAVAAFVVLTTAWLDARAQEAERRGTALPILWWPYSPDPRPGPETGLRRQYFDTPAPDFTLPDLRTGRPVTLSAFRGRPTVLIFGSFTCTLFCNQTPV